MHRRRGTAYQLLKLVEEGGEIGFWWLDLETGDLAGSLGLLQITGLSSETDARALFGDLIHPADRITHADILDVLQRGHPLARTFRIIRPDRTLRWVTVKGRTVLGPHDAPVRAEGVILDVTMSQEALLLAAENQARYQTFARSIATMAWTVSPTGQHSFDANWQSLTGQRTQDAQNDGWRQALHPEDRSRVAMAWHTAWTHRTTYDTDFRVLCVDGRYRWYNCRAAPVHDGDGSIKEWFGVLLEIVGSTRFASGRARQTAVELNPELGRGARAMLDWSALTLACAARVSVSSVKRFEAGGKVRRATLHAIRTAFEEKGFRFCVNEKGEFEICVAL